MYASFVVVFAREHFRILRCDGGGDAAGFIVMDSAGMELRREADFDAARAWVERRLQPPVAARHRR